MAARKPAGAARPPATARRSSPAGRKGAAPPAGMSRDLIGSPGRRWTGDHHGEDSVNGPTDVNVEELLDNPTGAEAAWCAIGGWGPGGVPSPRESPRLITSKMVAEPIVERATGSPRRYAGRIADDLVLIDRDPVPPQYEGVVTMNAWGADNDHAVPDLGAPTDTKSGWALPCPCLEPRACIGPGLRSLRRLPGSASAPSLVEPLPLERWRGAFRRPGRHSQRELVKDGQDHHTR
jgi:hypothetical protein